METDTEFDIKITVGEDLLSLCVNGNYSLVKANNLFKLAIDNAVSYNKSKILIDVTNITGSIPFLDRFRYSEFLATYRINNALGKVSSIAVVGQEPIVHGGKFGETVAVNRGTNARVFTNMSDAFIWLNNE